VLADFLGLVAWLMTVSRFTLAGREGARHDCGYRDRRYAPPGCGVPDRAVLLDDADSGILILDQHGAIVPGNDEVTAFVLAVANVANRALITAHGCRVDRAMKVLSAWMDEYGKQAEAEAHGRL
jgi:hypothetical protein